MAQRATDCERGLAWDETSRTTLFHDRFITIDSSSFSLPDGSEAGPYYLYSTHDSVSIIPVTNDGQIVCVRQFRPGVARVILELPAGGIDEKDVADASAGESHAEVMAAAARELREETGYVARELRYLGGVSLHATVSRDVNHCVLALGCERVGEQQLDPTEFLHVELVSPDELDALVHAGEFQQLSHAHAWLRWGRRARASEGGAR